jgi:hypothetical protein
MNKNRSILRNSLPSSELHRKKDRISIKKQRLIVGLDMGTISIRAVVGCVADNGIEIFGIGACPSLALRNHRDSWQQEEYLPCDVTCQKIKAAF